MGTVRINTIKLQQHIKPVFHQKPNANYIQPARIGCRVRQPEMLAFGVAPNVKHTV